MSLQQAAPCGIGVHPSELKAFLKRTAVIFLGAGLDGPREVLARAPIPRRRRRQTAASAVRSGDTVEGRDGGARPRRRQTREEGVEEGGALARQHRRRRRPRLRRARPTLRLYKLRAPTSWAYDCGRSDILNIVGYVSVVLTFDRGCHLLAVRMSPLMHPRPCEPQPRLAAMADGMRPSEVTEFYASACTRDNISDVLPRATPRLRRRQTGNSAGRSGDTEARGDAA